MNLVVVLDSNIWMQERMLRHSVGSAVRFFLHRSNARLVVPEVVRLEVELNLERELKELVSNLREGHKHLLSLVGQQKEQVLPSDEELRQIALDAFGNMGIEVFDNPFSLESARSSFEKCLRSEPPSGPKNQQFKDGVIWADCLALAKDSPVIFVTQDKGFYKDREYKRGLAENLAIEAKKVAHEISVVHELSSILERIRESIKIDYRSLDELHYRMIKERAERLVGSEGYTLGDLLGGEHSVFATDDPNVGYVEFSLRYQCIHPTQPEGLLVAEGECILNSTTGELSECRSRGEEFLFVSSEGEQQKRNTVFGVGSIVLGHRTVKHSIRALLD